jgi:hypothetical protein
MRLIDTQDFTIALIENKIVVYYIFYGSFFFFFVTAAADVAINIFPLFSVLISFNFTLRLNKFPFFFFVAVDSFISREHTQHIVSYVVVVVVVAIDCEKKLIVSELLGVK